MANGEAGAGRYRRRREWMRLHVASAASWPLWQVKLLGDKADRLQARILWWGERASKNASPQPPV